MATLDRGKGTGTEANEVVLLKLKLSSRERILFICSRTVVALGLAVLAGYCVVTGIGFFRIPHTEAEKIGVDVLGLHLSAGGLGSVIFGAGIIIAYFAARTAPKKLESSLDTDNDASDSAAQRAQNGGEPPAAQQGGQIPGAGPLTSAKLGLSAQEQVKETVRDTSRTTGSGSGASGQRTKMRDVVAGRPPER